MSLKIFLLQVPFFLCWHFIDFPSLISPPSSWGPLVMFFYHHGLIICLFIFADMVKNKGFLPSGPSEIPIQRNQIKEIIYSLLPACKDPDLDSGVPFKADAIVANPPAYGDTTLCPLIF